MTQWQSESVAMAQYDYWRTCIIYTYRHISTHKHIRIQNTLKCVLSAKHLEYRQYTQAAKKNTHTAILWKIILRKSNVTLLLPLPKENGTNERNSDKQFAFTLNEWICIHTNAHAIFNRTTRIFVILNLVTWYLYLTFLSWFSEFIFVVVFLYSNCEYINTS